MVDGRNSFKFNFLNLTLLILMPLVLRTLAILASATRVKTL